MTLAGETIRAARRHAALTQAELAERLGTSQAAVAQLEGPSANPTIATLQRALAAAGHRLDLIARPVAASIDESLVARQLAMSPEERVHTFELTYASARELARAAARARGELA